MTPDELAELDRLLSDVDIPLWSPIPGPQVAALECEADYLFYGGAAGGGKTDLLLGAALTQHQRSIIFRREYSQLKGIRDRAEDLYSSIGKYNGQLELWRLSNGRRVEFGACQFVGDESKYQGRPHDLKGFDEITHFTEAQFRFLTTWCRTPDPKQRCRTICAGNPPTNAEGDWVIKFWAPWLDPRHPNPAREGELRWFISDPTGDNDIEVPGGDPIWFSATEGLNVEDAPDSELIKPKSRTFIRAKIEHNPYLMSTGYKATLQALPEPLRSRMLKGDFGVGQEDAEWQVIPTAWVLAAQARWAPTYEQFLEKRALRELERQPLAIDKDNEDDDNILDVDALPNLSEPSNNSVSPPSPAKLFGLSLDAPKGLTHDPIMDAANYYESGRSLGVDVSRGGKDNTCYAPRMGVWFDEIKTVPGRQTRTGGDVIQKIIDFGYNTWRCQIDVSGIGASPVDIGLMYDMDVIPMNNSEKSYAKDRSGKLNFANCRAEWWWKMREALDPLLGFDVALPPDPSLLADLTTPRWSLSFRGIQVEDKKQIKDRIGRSPDKGDSVVLANAVPYRPGQGYLDHYKSEALALAQRAEEVQKARRDKNHQGRPKS